VAAAEAQLAKAEKDLVLHEKWRLGARQLIARASVEQATAMVKQTETELERLSVRASLTGESCSATSAPASTSACRLDKR